MRPSRSSTRWRTLRCGTSQRTSGKLSRLRGWEGGRFCWHAQRLGHSFCPSWNDVVLLGATVSRLPRLRWSGPTATRRSGQVDGGHSGKRRASFSLAQKKRETIQQLYKVSTPCVDDHHFKEEEMKSVGELSQVCSQIVVKCLYLARIGRPDILWSVNKLARSITKWTKACDKRFNRLISYIHNTYEHKQHCFVGRHC